MSYHVTTKKIVYIKIINIDMQNVTVIPVGSGYVSIYIHIQPNNCYRFLFPALLGKYQLI